DAHDDDRQLDEHAGPVVLLHVLICIGIEPIGRAKPAATAKFWSLRRLPINRLIQSPAPAQFTWRGGHPFRQHFSFQRFRMSAAKNGAKGTSDMAG
ncbi:MAG: hypothetical protein WCE51_12010, partial [Chthoniobacterales bacterium]